MVKRREWVFDLDDTLFSERDYVRSALEFTGSLVNKLFGTSDSVEQLKKLYSAGHTDPIGAFWLTNNLPLPAKETVVAAMRAHPPNIKLRSGAALLLNSLRRKNIGFSIMTDGRSLTQRAKIAALRCLDARVILISQESGWEKPDPRCYQRFESLLPDRCFTYVGDNLTKDFVTAKKFGWFTIMLVDDGNNIHRQDLPATAARRADFIVHDLSELL